jgi:hypothetical protein
MGALDFRGSKVVQFGLSAPAEHEVAQQTCRLRRLELNTRSGTPAGWRPI